MVDLEANVQGLGLDLQTEKNKNEELIEKSSKEIESLEEDLNNLKKKSIEEKDKLESELNQYPSPPQWILNLQHALLIGHSH